MDINRTTLNKVFHNATFLAVGIILAGVLYLTSPFWLPYVQGDPYIGSDKAAALGAETYFTVNAQMGFGTWIKRVCDISTQAGCELARSIAEANNMWQQVEAQGTDRKVKAQALEMVDTANDGMAAAVWKVLLTELSEGKSTEIFVVVVKEDDSWKFERFLMKQEADRYNNQDSQ